MTSQDPPLTRREARERERLLAEQAASLTPQNAASAQPDATVPAPAQPPVAAPRPAPAPQPVGSTAGPSTAYASPSYGARGAGSAPPVFGTTPARPPAVNPFAPPPAAPSAPARREADRSTRPDGSSSAQDAAPERTLTRRELRALLGTHLDDDLETDGIDDLVKPAAGSSVAPPASAPAAPAPAAPALSARPSAPPAASVPAMPKSDQDDTGSLRPAGHWTAQLNAPEEEPEPFDQLLSRGGVSRGVPTTTNALILPSLPDQGGLIAGPLAASGELLVTGSVDLPRSLGSTGVHPSQVDSNEIDRLFEKVEDVSTSGVAPVSATRAISTQAATHQVMTPPKKERPNAPLILAVTAGVLALGVVATFVIGAVTGQF